MGSVAEKAVDTLPVRLAIGLMSGTSLDGIDAALIETDGEHHIRPIAFRSEPYSEQARRQLQDVTALAWSYDRPRQSPEIVAATEMLTRRHLLAIRQLLATAGVPIEDVDVIGFHGQTVAHRPDRGWTWQIGDGDAMAAALGIPVSAVLPVSPATPVASTAGADVIVLIGSDLAAKTPPSTVPPSATPTVPKTTTTTSHKSSKAS